MIKWKNFFFSNIFYTFSKYNLDYFRTKNTKHIPQLQNVRKISSHHFPNEMHEKTHSIVSKHQNLIPTASQTKYTKYLIKISSQSIPRQSNEISHQFLISHPN